MEGKHKCHFCNELISDDEEVMGSKHGEPVCESCLESIQYGLPIKKKEVRKHMKNEIQTYNNGDELTELKNFMYDILEAEDDLNDNASITANQGLGVQLTNNMKKDGVTIIQNQSVVNKKVTNNVVKALRIIDRIKDSSATTIKLETENKNNPEITMDHIIQVIEWIATKKISLKALDGLMRGLYCKEMVRKIGSSIKAAEVIGVSQAHVSKLSREVDMHIDNIEDDEAKQLEVIE